LFRDGGAFLNLRLVDDKTTTTGVDDRDIPTGLTSSMRSLSACP